MFFFVQEEECAVSSSTGGDLTMSASHHEPSHISEEEVDGFTIIPSMKYNSV